MFDSLIQSVFLQSESTASTLTGSAFLACALAALVLGVAIAGIYMFRHRYTKNFVVTLALLPLIVQMVILLVNGNIGAGIAVMGVFNLVRFRSIPGSAKDIGAVFLAMAVGLACGMGYLALAAAFTVIVGIANVIFVLSPLGSGHEGEKSLRISIPEDLDYTSAFDTILGTYTTHWELVNAKTTNMESLYQLDYHVVLKDPLKEKELLDTLRTENGNLSVQFGRITTEKETL